MSRREMLARSGACGLAGLGLAVRVPDGMRNYPGLVLDKNPIGYWRLGEQQGPTATDSSAQMRHGTIHGEPAFREHGALAGDSNTVVALEGRRSYIEVPDSADFSVPTSGNGLTIEAWMRPDAVIFDGQTDEHYVHWMGKGEPGKHEWGFRFYSNAY